MYTKYSTSNRLMVKMTITSRLSDGTIKMETKEEPYGSFESLDLYDCALCAAIEIRATVNGKPLKPYARGKCNW